MAKLVNISISIVTPISTVVAGEDYVVFTEPVTVTFAVDSPPAPPSPSECFSIEILDDNVLEGDQEFTVTITNTSDNAAISTTSSVSTVHILDNEGLKLTHMIL